MFHTFRFRLTVWYVTLFAVLLAGFSVLVYALLAHAIESRVRDMLASEIGIASHLLPDEINEAAGDELKGAKETVTELQFRGGTIAIFAGGHLIASSGPYAAGEDARVARGEVRVNGKSFEAVAMMPASAVDDDLRVLRRVLLLTLPLFLALAGIGGYFTAKRSLRPLESFARQTQTITEQTLYKRLYAEDAAEELAVVAASFNELLSRLDTSFDAMRRFVADASHELRTPLAVIRGEAEVSLSKPRDAVEYRESLTVILDESRRLSRLVEDLLNLARSDAGRIQLNRTEFYFNDLVADCCRSMESLARGKGVQVGCAPAPDLPYVGDESLLRRLVLNLLDNGIRYTPAGGKVAVRVEAEPEGVRLRVSDTGIGIPPDAAPHVFERFFRTDKARSREQGGFGLGLSIVKFIAESHRGTVQLDSEPSRGSTFTVMLPH